MEKKGSQICPVCLDEILLEECRKVSYPQGNSQTFDKIIFCKKCTLGIAQPRLTDEEINSIYERGEFWKVNDVKLLSPRLNPGPYALAEARWSLIEKVMPKQSNISVLDVGAGHGFFGRVAAKGLKINKYCAIEKDELFQEAIKKVVLNVPIQVEGDLEKVKDHYDLIVCSQILEHMNEPRLFLKKIIERLSSNGVLFIDLPNQDYEFKENAYPHLLFFNLKSVKKMLADMGLKVQFINNFGHGADCSPINYRNKNSLKCLLEKVIYKLRRILPLWFTKRFFSFYLGAEKQNFNGTWIRAIAIKF